LAASLSRECRLYYPRLSSGRTIAEQDLYRVDRECGPTACRRRKCDKASAFARQRIELIRTGSFEKLDAAQREVAGQRWFTDYVHRLNRKDFAFGAKNIAYDGRPVWERVKCPVLVVVGERDTIVSIEESARPSRALLRHAGNTDVTVKMVPDADPLLHQTKTGSPGEMQAADQLKAFASGYLSTLTAGWATG